MGRSSRVSVLTRVAPLATAVMLAVAACGGDSPSTSTAGSSGPAGASESVSPEWQKVIDAAKEEGGVTIYSSQGTDLLEDLAKGFEQKYGIHVTVGRDVDANIEAKLNAESSSNQPTADVVAIADGGFVSQKAQQNWWTMPTGPAFDAPDFDKATYLAADGSFISSSAVFALGWNTQYVPKGLEGYEGLLDSDLEGHIGVNDPAVSPAVVDFYDYLTEQTNPDFVDELAAQNPQIFSSVLQIAQSLTSGQIWAGLAVPPLVDEMEAGAPVEFIVPKPAWGAPFHTAILANAPHPNAAQLLADYMISPQGQEAIARKTASVLPNTKGAVTTVADVRAFDPTQLSSDHAAQFRAEFKQKFQ